MVHSSLEIKMVNSWKFVKIFAISKLNVGVSGSWSLLFPRCCKTPALPPRAVSFQLSILSRSAFKKILYFSVKYLDITDTSISEGYLNLGRNMDRKKEPNLFFTAYHKTYLYLQGALK